LVEEVLITSAFLALVLGMVDLGDAVFQNHVVSEASRQGARIASVQGSLAPSDWNGGPWGPTAYSGAGNSTDTIPTTISNAGALTGLNPANVTISVQWPTGDNIAENGDTVQVTVSTTWTPVYGYVFGSSPYTLSATSIMPIAH
jgi:Flp pilus assembly protein TadG